MKLVFLDKVTVTIEIHTHTHWIRTQIEVLDLAGSANTTNYFNTYKSIRGA
jgi:hypothetical protein